MNRRGSTLAVAILGATMLAGCAATGVGSANVQSSASTVPGAGSTPASTVASVTGSPSPSAVPATTTPTPAPPSPEASASASTLSGPTYKATQQPSLAAKGAGIPAIPTAIKLDFPSDPCVTPNPEESCERVHVAWHEANPSGVTIRVYAVTQCLHKPSASRPNVKCLVDGDTIPKGALVLLGSPPALAGSFSFILGIGETAALGWLPGFGPDVDAIVLQAVNDRGGSAFAIAASAAPCWQCVL